MSTPLFCPTCNFVMNTFNDSVSYEELGCCAACHDNWGTNVILVDKESKAYKSYIEKRIYQTKSMLPILRFE